MFWSERLLLRNFRADDFEAVHAYATDLGVVRYMTWGPNSEAETRDFLKRAQSHTEVDPRVEFELAVIREEPGDLLVEQRPERDRRRWAPRRWIQGDAGLLLCSIRLGKRLRHGSSPGDVGLWIQISGTPPHLGLLRSRERRIHPSVTETWDETGRAPQGRLPDPRRMARQSPLCDS